MVPIHELQVSMRQALSYVLNIVFTHSDRLIHLRYHVREVVLAIEIALTSFYLIRKQATYAEAFYGFKRSTISHTQQLSVLSKRIIALSVFFEAVWPYLKDKFRKHDSRLVRLVLKALRILKFWQAFLYLTNEKCLYYQPYLRVFSVLVRRQNPFEQKADDSVSLPWRILSQYNIFILYLFKVYCEWHFSAMKQAPSQASELVQAPKYNLEISKRFRKGYCPLCSQKAQNPAILTCSGYLFCFSCISRHVGERGTCPIAGVPAS